MGHVTEHATQQQERVDALAILKHLVTHAA